MTAKNRIQRLKNGIFVKNMVVKGLMFDYETIQHNLEIKCVATNFCGLTFNLGWSNIKVCEF